MTNPWAKAFTQNYAEGGLINSLLGRMDVLTVPQQKALIEAGAATPEEYGWKFPTPKPDSTNYKSGSSASQDTAKARGISLDELRDRQRAELKRLLKSRSYAEGGKTRLPAEQKGFPSMDSLNEEFANTKAALTGFTGIGDEPSVMYPEARDTYNKAELASILSQLVGVHPTKAALSPIAEAIAPTLRALPKGMSVRELSTSLADREVLDDILKPWLKVGSSVNPEDRAIFTDMREALQQYPDVRTRVLLNGEEPQGAYQLVNKGDTRYIPNVAVAKQHRGLGTALMEHAIANREAPTSLYSAPGKEGFYRKHGMKESLEDGISKFSFAKGGTTTQDNGVISGIMSSIRSGLSDYGSQVAERARTLRDQPISTLNTLGQDVIRQLQTPEGALDVAMNQPVSPLMGLAGVIKNKGGNWLSGSVEGALGGLKKHIPEDFVERQPFTPHPELLGNLLDRYGDIVHAAGAQRIQGDQSINQWIDKPLTRYVKNEMATPEDPLRALAERGVLHYDPTTIRESRNLVHPSGEELSKLGQSEAAKGWENLSDRFVYPNLAGNISFPKTLAENPWLESVKIKNPATSIYSRGSLVNSEDLGFNHLIDELSNAINPESGLPRHLQFPADRLDKVSVPQAVERVDAINKWRAALKIEADQAKANNAATVLHKEYPEGKYFRAGEGNFFTPDREAAEQFGQNFGGAVTQHHIEPRRSAGEADIENVAKMLGIHQKGTPVGQYLEQGDNAVFDEASQMIEELRNQGFDTALINDGMSKHPSLVVLDPSIVKKSSPNPKGLKWVELKSPESIEGWERTSAGDWLRPGGQVEMDETGNFINPAKSTLQDALKYEGDTMGHCVGGYCDDVASGKSKIYSLRDSKGQPHTTIEVRPSDWFTEMTNRSMDDSKVFNSELKRRYAEAGISPKVNTEEARALGNSLYAEMFGSEPAPTIVQIKGKGNLKPADEYQPFVQDFVKSGKWSDVGDLRNTGLTSVPMESPLAKRLIQEGREVPNYMTDGEYEALTSEFGMPKYAAGGLVTNKVETPEQLRAIIRDIQSRR